MEAHAHQPTDVARTIQGTPTTDAVLFSGGAR